MEILTTNEIKDRGDINLYIRWIQLEDYNRLLKAAKTVRKIISSVDLLVDEKEDKQFELFLKLTK
jgi:hypothetical protein